MDVPGIIVRLRTFATTVAATTVGIINVATRRGESAIELSPGDAAPDFSLPASDGRTYRLSELAGQVVAIAWFPKAFTGG